MVSQNFDRLLDGLGKHLEKEVRQATKTSQSFGPGRDNKLLRSVVIEAGLIYDGVQFLAGTDRSSTLHLIKAPLAQVIEILKHEANIDSVLVALGAPAMLALNPDQQAVDQAVATYEALLDDLDKIARAVPTPVKRGRGKPPAKDLRILVEFLADYWERVTERPFKQYWHKENGRPKKPATNAAAFVYNLVEFIDAERLDALPKMTEAVVASRRESTS